MNTESNTINHGVCHQHT